MKETVWYKIVDLKDGKINTLFHGLNGSKIIPRNEWLKADKKMVNDGKGPLYLSGWHIIPSYDLCIKYLKRFKNVKYKAIVKCYAKDIVPKKHSRSQVFLADYIYILDK